MRCREAEEQLAVYRELTAEERAAVDAHLAACRVCASLAAASRTMDARLAALPALDPPPRIRAEVFARLGLGEAQGQQGGRGSKPVVRLVAGLAGAALLVAMAIGLSSVFSGPRPDLRTVAPTLLTEAEAMERVVQVLFQDPLGGPPKAFTGVAVSADQILTVRQPGPPLAVVLADGRQLPVTLTAEHPDAAFALLTVPNAAFAPALVSDPSTVKVGDEVAVVGVHAGDYVVLRATVLSTDAAFPPTFPGGLIRLALGADQESVWRAAEPFGGVAFDAQNRVIGLGGSMPEGFLIIPVAQIQAGLGPPGDHPLISVSRAERDFQGIELVNYGLTWRPLSQPETAGLRWRSLIAADQPGSSIPLQAGEPLTVTTMWWVTSRPSRDWVISVRLISPQQEVVAQAGEEGQPTFPFSAISYGGTVQSHVLPLPPDLPAGVYTVTLSLEDPATGARLKLADGSGDQLALAELLVGSGETPSTVTPVPLETEVPTVTPYPVAAPATATPWVTPTASAFPSPTPSPAIPTPTPSVEDLTANWEATWRGIKSLHGVHTLDTLDADTGEVSTAMVSFGREEWFRLDAAGAPERFKVFTRTREGDEWALFDGERSARYDPQTDRFYDETPGSAWDTWDDVRDFSLLTHLQPPWLWTSPPALTWDNAEAVTLDGRPAFRLTGDWDGVPLTLWLDAADFLPRRREITYRTGVQGIHQVWQAAVLDVNPDLPDEVFNRASLQTVSLPEVTLVGTETDPGLEVLDVKVLPGVGPVRSLPILPTTRPTTSLGIQARIRNATDEGARVWVTYILLDPQTGQVQETVIQEDLPAEATAAPILGFTVDRDVLRWELTVRVQRLGP